MKTQKGVTIIELLIVITIIGIISGFTVVAVGGYLSSSKLKIDQEIIVSLNEATTGYHILNNSSIIFSEDSTNTENIELLFTEGFLSSVAIPNTNDAEFIWNNSSNIWYLSVDGTATALSPYGTTPAEIAPSIASDIETHFADEGSYGRTWGDYQYTDLGLDPDDWNDPIMHVYYRPSGSKLLLTPEDGYQFVLTDIDGDKFTLTSSLNWNLIYDSTTGKWYYHTISSATEVDFSSMIVELS